MCFYPPALSHPFVWRFERRLNGVFFIFLSGQGISFCFLSYPVPKAGQHVNASYFLLIQIPDRSPNGLLRMGHLGAHRNSFASKIWPFVKIGHRSLTSKIVLNKTVFLWMTARKPTSKSPNQTFKNAGTICILYLLFRSVKTAWRTLQVLGYGLSCPVED